MSKSRLAVSIKLEMERDGEGGSILKAVVVARRGLFRR